jgi:hypothetical protein
VGVGASRRRTPMNTSDDKGSSLPEMIAKFQELESKSWTVQQVIDQLQKLPKSERDKKFMIEDNEYGQQLYFGQLEVDSETVMCTQFWTAEMYLLSEAISHLKEDAARAERYRVQPESTPPELRRFLP